MALARTKSVQMAGRVAFQVALWAVTAWLLYPLVVLDSVTFYNAKSYLFRSAFGIVIMIILLGKTIFDLLFPQEVSQKKSLLYTLFLTLYSLAITGGVIFVVTRMLVLFFKQNRGGFVL